MKMVWATILVPSVCLYDPKHPSYWPNAYEPVSAFGILTLAQGFIHTWGALAAIRFLLGAFEGLMLPSTLFRKETPLCLYRNSRLPNNL